MTFKDGLSYTINEFGEKNVFLPFDTVEENTPVVNDIAPARCDECGEPAIDTWHLYITGDNHHVCKKCHDLLTAYGNECH